ncbi:MAG TPA: hypothetical protein VIF57_22780 [Polyangia bacterium]
MTIGVPAAAHAADSREAREREARKACFTGNVDRGVEILVDLYGETGHPNYIYNQARCFERNGKYDQAVLSYEDYLRKATNLPEAERAQVEKSIAELRAKLASDAEGGATAAPALLAPTMDAATAAPAAKPPEPSLLPTPAGDTAGGADWSWQRKAGVISLVAAGGGLAVGVAGSILRHSRGNDFNGACTYFQGQPAPITDTSGADCRGKYDAVQGADRMMWIGYVSAGVLAGAGATLLLLAPRRQPGAWAARCAPTLASTGVACGWSF